MNRLALLLVPVFALTLAAAPAWADDGEGPGGGDLKQRIQKKMQSILELMKQNEAALLKLSTGKSATTKKVDVAVPPESKGGGASGAEGTSGQSGAQGQKIREKMDELISGQRKSGGQIPDELKQLTVLLKKLREQF